MSTHVNATVVGGMLQPDVTLGLADQTRVKLTIEPLGDQSATARQVWQELKEMITSQPLHGLGRRLTRDELYERG